MPPSVTHFQVIDDAAGTLVVKGGQTDVQRNQQLVVDRPDADWNGDRTFHDQSAAAAFGKGEAAWYYILGVRMQRISLTGISTVRRGGF